MTINKMVFSEEMEKEDIRSNEVRTAKIMVKIANSLEDKIQVTWDVPSNDARGRMPVLDLSVWVREINGVQKNLDSFYKKTAATLYTILKRSALSFRIKKSTLPLGD